MIKLASRTFSFKNLVFLIYSSTTRFRPEEYATKAVQSNWAQPGTKIRISINDEGLCFNHRALRAYDLVWSS